MIAVISNRGAVRMRLRKGLSGVRSTDFAEFDNVEDFVGRDVGATIVVLDIIAALVEPDAAADLGIWCRMHSGAKFLAYGAEGKVEAISLLVSMARECAIEVVTPKQGADEAYWRAQFHEVQHGEAQLHIAIRERFTQAVQDTGRTVRLGSNHILLFLDCAPSNPSVAQIAKAFYGGDVAAKQVQATRLARKHRAEQTLLASDLIVLMKVLWWVHLREAGWQPARITTFLHTNRRNWRKQTNDRLRLTSRVLNELPASLVFAWVASLCVEPYTVPPSPREIVARLAATAHSSVSAGVLADLRRAKEATRATVRNQL